MYTKQITIIDNHAQVTVEVQNHTLSVVSGLTLDDQCPDTFGIADLDAYMANNQETYDFCFAIGKAVRGIEKWSSTAKNNATEEMFMAMMVAEVLTLLDPLFRLAKMDGMYRTSIDE